MTTLVQSSQGGSLAQAATRHGLGTVAAVRPGCALTAEGGPARDAFLVLDGVARVTRDGRLVGEVGPGQFVGEMGLIDHRPRSASVVAVSAMRVIAFDAPAFEALLADPVVDREVRRQVVGRLRALLLTPIEEPNRRNQP